MKCATAFCLLRCFDSCLLSCRQLRGVFPFSIMPSLQEPPCKLFSHLFLEPTQDLAHAGCDHPGFYSENQYQLDHSFKENPDTRGTVPSLMRILFNLCHTACALARFLDTVGKSSSASDITHPKYLKEFTISRGHP